ncbi:hypothetical protein HanPI659440_Chr08g0286801 [Helianthus annuus]|uniref:Uncharacterized protein n=1 Tax=Helianthus annuus TaxID=4232 RepID=A0A9K3ID49_HELAN|nr:hypothetical protein HanXRQr2_Chr08g0327451 [Helianthus annuus]KAJ0552653.1 hypothetical protein HanHA89_Chr08g0287581 [Helianthus annuus]KAJ0763958.1 hypothetical protein HanPI659440_Chr08g0286801 [Helianthus annuus]
MVVVFTVEDDCLVRSSFRRLVILLKVKPIFLAIFSSTNKPHRVWSWLGALCLVDCTGISRRTPFRQRCRRCFIFHIELGSAVICVCLMSSVSR